MKKILLGLCALSAVSTTALAAYHETAVGTPVELTVTGTINVKDETVIPGKKIVIYKDGPIASGDDNIVMNFNVKKGLAIDSNLTKQKFWIKEVPLQGLTETEIRGNGNNVAASRIQVAYSATPTGSLSYFTIGAGQHWSLTGASAGTLKFKTTYNTTASNLEVFLEGNAGGTAGAINLNGKFAIKVTQ